MKTGRLKTGVIAIALLSAACEAKAQDKVEASASADLVSGYIWRGQDLGGVSIQPGLTLSYKGFSVCDISLSASKEIRITDSFSLPLFVKATWNPRTEGAYFVAGISF